MKATINGSMGINEAMLEDASNIMWQIADRQKQAPPAEIAEAMVAPPALRHASGQAGEMLNSMGSALMQYIRGEVEAARQSAQAAVDAVQDLAQSVYDEEDDVGLPRRIYSMPDGTTLAKCHLTQEWEQVR